MKAKTRIQQQKRRRAQQALRRTRLAPSRLADLFRLANLAPANFELKDVGRKLFRNLPSPSVDPNRYARMFNKAVEAFLSEVPSALSDYLWSPLLPEGAVEGDDEELDGSALAAQLTRAHEAALDRYCLVREAREAFRTISDIAASDRIEEAQSCFGFHLRTYSCLRIDEKGRVSVRQNPIIEALGGQGIEAARIRICTICKQVFWAGRLDQFRCSKQCGQIHRVRTWRERYPETYKPRRILGKSAANSDNKGA